MHGGGPAQGVLLLALTCLRPALIMLQLCVSLSCFDHVTTVIYMFVFLVKNIDFEAYIQLAHYDFICLFTSIFFFTSIIWDQILISIVGALKPKLITKTKPTKPTQPNLNMLPGLSYIFSCFCCCFCQFYLSSLHCLPQ